MVVGDASWWWVTCLCHWSLPLDAGGVEVVGRLGKASWSWMMCLHHCRGRWPVMC